MKCSSQRNCNRARVHRVLGLNQASMKCSSQRNCNGGCAGTRRLRRGLNEVQFPKELQHILIAGHLHGHAGLNEVQFPKELQRPVRAP